MYISPSGGRCGIDMSQITTLPKNSPGVGRLNQVTPQADIDALTLLKDGSDGDKVSCTFGQSAPGTEDININVESKGVSFILQATTAGNVANNAFVLFEGPLTGGDSYQSPACTVTTHRVVEGGGEGLIHYTCAQFGAESKPDSVCTAEGWVYATDCGK